MIFPIDYVLVINGEMTMTKHLKIIILSYFTLLLFVASIFIFPISLYHLLSIFHDETRTNAWEIYLFTFSLSPLFPVFLLFGISYIRRCIMQRKITIEDYFTKYLSIACIIFSFSAYTLSYFPLFAADIFSFYQPDIIFWALGGVVVPIVFISNYKFIFKINLIYQFIFFMGNLIGIVLINYCFNQGIILNFILSYINLVLYQILYFSYLLGIVHCSIILILVEKNKPYIKPYVCFLLISLFLFLLLLLNCDKFYLIFSFSTVIIVFALLKLVKINFNAIHRIIDMKIYNV